MAPGWLTALGTIAGGVSGYGDVVHREDQEQLQRAMDQLKMEQAKRSMGLVQYDPTAQDSRVKELDPQRLKDSIGLTPSTTDSAMGALSKRPSITEGRTDPGGLGDPGRFGAPISLNDPVTGKKQFYRSDETQSDTGRQIRREDAKQQSMDNRQDNLLHQRQAFDKDKLRQTNRGYFDVLHTQGYLPKEARFETYQDSEGLKSSFDDYMARTKSDEAGALADRRTAAMVNGIAGMNRQDKLAQQEAEGEAYLYNYPANSQEEVDNFKHTFGALRKQHPDWTPGKVAYVLKTSAMGVGKEANLDARTDNTNARTKKLTTNIFGGGAATPATVSGTITRRDLVQPSAPAKVNLPAGPIPEVAPPSIGKAPPSQQEWDALAAQYGAMTVTGKYGARPPK